MKRRKFIDLILKGSAGLAVAGSSLLTGCSESPNVDSDLLSQYKTLSAGEPTPTFIMCPPDDLGESGYKQEAYEEAWKTLKQTIEGLGGNVITLDASIDAGYGEVWTRDPALVFPKQKLFIIDSTPHTKEEQAYKRNLPEETKQISKALEKEGFRKVDIQASLAEGGDVIIDEDRKIVFVGYSDLESPKTQNTITSIQEHTGYEVFPIRRQLRKDKANHLSSQRVGEFGFSVFYHLDTGMAKLPKGGYLISESITDTETLEKLQNLLGKDLIIVEDKLEADFWKTKVRDTTYTLTPAEDAKYKLGKNTQHMAYNLISIGDTLIMPYCSDELMNNLQDKGYKVVTPKTLNLDGIKWEFSNGSIHCATNKISQTHNHQMGAPLYGITPPQKQKWQDITNRPPDSVKGLS